MPPSPAKSLSPAELAKLEQAFASDPSSGSYKPLAEAYLGLGRHMEAMVVCKKGVKAFPQSAEPRVLLARVYADQGKDKKALEELAAAPPDKAALRLAGTLHLKLHELEAGRAALQKALALDPSDPETLEALAAAGMAAAPPAAAVPPPAPVAASTGPRPAVGSAPTVTGPTLGSMPASPAPAPAPAAPAAARPPPPPPDASGAFPAVPPPRAAVAVAPPALRVAEWSEPAPVREPPRPRRSSPALFFGLLVLFGGATGGYWVLGQKNAREKREVKKLLDQAGEHLRHDAFDAYVGACKAAEEALDIRPDSGVAHGYLAYAWTIRWGEHGGGDEARKQAEEHLEAARRSGEESSYLYAAEALFAASSGKGGEARAQLEERVKAFDAQGKASATLYLTLGLVQLRAGDLARAKESLDRAQVLAPSDARIYAGLANLYRRRGQDAQATQNFAYALRYEPGHPESVLGWSLLELDKDAPDYARVAATLKRLLEQQPPPSPRQLAGAHLARALLVGRVSGELPGLKADPAKALAEATGVSRDAAKAQADIQREEQAGFDADKGNPELRLVKAKRLRFAKDVDGAVAELREAIAADPTRAQFHVELALALREKQGGEQEVVDALNTALQAMGDSPRLTVMLGDTLRRQGKLDEAVAQYEKALAGPGKNPDARLSLGVALRLMKETGKALEALDKAAQEFLGNDGKVAECQLETARTHESVEDMPKADAAYQKALTTDPSLAEGYYWYGRFLMKDRKMHGKGRDLFEKYLELEPRGRYAADAEKLVKERDREQEKER